MIRCDRSSWVSRLSPIAARVGRGRELGQHVVVEEVGERAVADVVEQARHPQRLDDQALGRDGLAGREASAVRRLG